MKRKLALLLAAAMMLLSACGGASSSAAPASSETPAPASSEEAAPASSKSASSEAAGLFAPVSKDEIKIGVIHISDPAEGSGYTYTHDQGIVGMQQNLGLRDDQIIRKIKVADNDATAIETAMLECIEEGCNIIFATSWGYMDTCEALAEEYPDVIFSHGTGYKSNGSNFNNYFGRIYQARYLSGIAAGLKTESNKIGYVAAWGPENGEVTSGCDAFAMGAYSVNPDCQVIVKTTNSWFDPEGEKQAAEALIAEGCDVIGQHCDTPNPQLAAEEAGVWGVGYNSDMRKDAPKAVLTSAVWNWSAYYTWAVENVINGTWTGENYYGGLAEGFVDITGLSDLCADGTAEAIEEARKKIVSGEWDVFEGEIEANDGQMHTSEYYSDVNWYFKNIVVK
ncbi:MAG: BMP family ABC transporter substrate-binding protein [Oscillospiraceae bacterium]|mgnify:CR=1 FL=1|nr:BMP family ABC transporter substrate-binding protein [Oscillospiraceae bacterium]MDY3218187.1 BMP family ABC transporter substrate-binding protein [Candidatus Fimivivens sp.]